MSFRKSIVLIFAFVLATGLSAQNTRTASGSYIYYAPENITLEHAKLIALERAMTQIIADEFGTYVEMANMTKLENSGQNSSVEMHTLALSDVKGEWLETLRGPDYDISWEQGMLVIKVKVTGRIRKLDEKAPVSFEAKLLRNGLGDNAESIDFKEGDEMFLSFRSPSSGYLAVYLHDGGDKVYRLLPYALNPDQSPAEIKARRRHVFFSTDKAFLPDGLDPYYVSELVMTCSQSVEFNRVYVVFNPSYFMIPMDDENDIPQMDYRQFQSWLIMAQSKNDAFQVQKLDITVRK